MTPKIFKTIVSFVRQRLQRLRSWRSSKKLAVNPQASDPAEIDKAKTQASSDTGQGTGKTSSISSPAVLPIALVNHTSSANVYVYIIGLSINDNEQWFFLRSDGITGYYPTSPSSTGAPLQADVAIQLGAPGTTRTVSIPPLAGGRIYVAIDSPLTFLLNPGPALVEPSVTNPSDPNLKVMWDFCEFTFNGAVYANISYVDFVSIPISLSLTNVAGGVQTVPGMPVTGLSTICANLEAQAIADGVRGWSNLVVSHNGSSLRALSPNSRLALSSTDFADYWTSYVDQVWSKYTSTALTIKSYDNSINASGAVTSASGNLLLFDKLGFSKPSTADIFSCNTGPFATGTDGTRNILIPQLAAAFNRSTLLESSTTPTNVKLFYQSSTTNHYARIVHAAQNDGKGYAFAYDDVAPADGSDQSGYVTDPNPQLWTVTFGGL